MNRILKTNWFILILFFCISIYPLTAQTIKDVFASSKTAILYLGIDFTQVRLINDVSKTGIVVRDEIFPAINSLVINEPKKYDLKGAFHKKLINNSLDIVTKRNKEINAENILSAKLSDYSWLKEEDINKLVSGIDFESKKGIGLLFIVEGMKKEDRLGTSLIWITFVDMGANKVLMTERLEGMSSGGATFRNYWASTIYSVLYSIDNRKYHSWKRKYGR